MVVSNALIVIMVFNLLFGIALPIGTMLWLKRNKKAQCSCFFVGAAAMALFALVLERAVHSVVLGHTSIAQNIYLYALYGGIMAGLFEETGRFVSMRFALKKRQGNRANALMYGAGHGGLEMMIVLSLGMVNNIIYAVMLNAGIGETLLAPLDETNRAALRNAFSALINMSPAQFLLSPMERIGAFTAQMALSAIVWLGAVEKRRGMWILAVALHAALDGTAVLIAGLGVPVLSVECLIWAEAAAIVYLAARLWKDQYCTFRMEL